MAKKEVKTDLWVHDLLNEAGIVHDAQGSEIVEIDNALKTASKSGTGNVGFPEYVGIVKDFLIVIEDKASIQDHEKRDDDGLLAMDVKSVKKYAMNGAFFYGRHLIRNTTYKKVFAIGVSGTSKKHRITPIFIDDRCNVFYLDDVESFISFSENNIDEFYLRDVLKEDTDKEKELAEILADAKELHEHLRNYGNMKDEEKPLVVSGILLALRERDNRNFSIDSLTGESGMHAITDGQKIYNAIESSFKRTDLSPITKIDKILSQFSIIKDSTKLNEVNQSLGETPLKFFTKFLDEKLYKSIKFSKSTEDFLGRFYGEFMHYSGGSGQTLGIVLTPKHITELFCELLDLKKTDRVFDSCCGTGGFLVAALHTMLSKTDVEAEKKSIRKNQLYGIEQRSDMFTIATTNMILRGDGKSNLQCDDFLQKNPKELQSSIRSTVGMMNPPYSQGSKNNPEQYEIAFTEHLLDSLLPGGRCAVIVPQSSMTGKSKEELDIKRSILNKHTLEGVVMLQKDTFYGVGTIPCIAIFTAGEPHPKEKICKFINFEDDGYKVSPHIGLLETESAKDKRQHLLDVWFDRIEAENKFCVKSTITAEEEWLHSFYYFNDEIPSEKSFDKVVGDYLSFEFSMIMQGRKYLFEGTNKQVAKYNEIAKLEEKEWRAFPIDSIFKIESGCDIYDKERIEGKIPYITSSAENNGIKYFVSNMNSTYESNVIAVNRNGSVGYAFYHKYPALFSNDCRKLKILHCPRDNEAVSLFMTTQIMQQKEKYNYCLKMGTNRLSRQKIMLPIDDKGNPDYPYMEQYIKNIFYKKAKEYLDFKT
ncbi:Type I restriction modification DNA specificity domain-containing protein [Fibrobacter sp. UWT2]|uniref:N-6 DNA methylase n=1 Tax=Fibrobacter sp. UWT2 TaxID=1896224 RepID=UPI000916A516|nr:N-6 DNA methylase [Fibrobacter sp. UWT2]SHL24778.1 Type I restriction modification DNA specificity domain-containing protein [Fibrobacter sp. UWT2]